jgi:hypothetical protein
MRVARNGNLGTEDYIINESKYILKKIIGSLSTPKEISLSIHYENKYFSFFIHRRGVYIHPPLDHFLNIDCENKFRFTLIFSVHRHGFDIHRGVIMILKINNRYICYT